MCAIAWRCSAAAGRVRAGILCLTAATGFELTLFALRWPNAGLGPLFRIRLFFYATKSARRGGMDRPWFDLAAIPIKYDQINPVQ